MNINFNVYAPNKSNFSTFKGQNNQRISFAQDYLDLYNSKKESILESFYETTIPEAKEELDNAKKEIYRATALNYDMINNGTKTYKTSEKEIALLSKRKNGLKSQRVIRVYKGKNLTKEITVLSRNHTQVKVYKDSRDNYDLFECDYSNNLVKCYKNVSEKDAYNSYSYDADKVYTFEGTTLVEYQEGYHYSENQKDKQLYVEKSMERLFNQQKEYKYLEGASYSYNPITKTPKLQECVSCLKI